MPVPFRDAGEGRRSGRVCRTMGRGNNFRPVIEVFTAGAVRTVEGGDHGTNRGGPVLRAPVPSPRGPDGPRPEWFPACPSPPSPRRRSLSAERVSARIAATLAAPAEARRLVARACADLPRGLIRETELLVTELVTNAVRHGGLSADDMIDLHLALREGSMRVEVAEGGPGFDPSVALAPDPEAIGGWGLLLVSRMASRWGVTRGSPNVAWFEIDLPR